MPTTPENETFAKPDVMLRVPVGLSSPLWGFFAGAAMSGTAWWLMTRWARPQNLEAMFGRAVLFEAPVEATTEAAVEPLVEEAVEAEVVAEAPEPVVEAAPEPTAERIPEPVLEAEPPAISVP